MTNRIIAIIRLLPEFSSRMVSIRRTGFLLTGLANKITAIDVDFFLRFHLSTDSFLGQAYQSIWQNQ